MCFKCLYDAHIEITMFVSLYYVTLDILETNAVITLCSLLDSIGSHTYACAFLFLLFLVPHMNFRNTLSTPICFMWHSWGGNPSYSIYCVVTLHFFFFFYLVILAAVSVVLLHYTFFFLFCIYIFYFSIKLYYLCGCTYVNGNKVCISLS